MKSIFGRRNFGVVWVCIAVVCLATETAKCRTIMVRADGNGDYPTIQDAIDDSNDSDVIILAEGIYTGTGNRDIDFLGKAVTVSSTDPTDPDIVAATIIDCQDSGRGFYFHSGEDANSILDGFTIKNGYASDYGGGVYCVNKSSPTLMNCIFTNNSATDGGAIRTFYTHPTITNCTFFGNTARGDGGAIENHNGSLPTIINCIFAYNSAGVDGGAIRNGNSDHSIINSTFFGNSASRGGGIYNWYSGPRLTNCILWGNRDSGGMDESAQIDTTSIPTRQPVVKYCCIQGLTGKLGGMGNIGENPLFVDSTIGDYHLLAISPCIDAGDNTAVPEDTTDLDGDGDTTEPVPLDLDGNPRFFDDPFTLDTGNGTPPIVDMGAYEAVYIDTAPVACIVGGDKTIEVGSGCEARVTLDGSCSSDADSTPGTNDDIEYFDWYEEIDPCDPNSDISLGSGEIIECNLPLGEHTIILEVTDKADAFDTNEVIITVEDTTPPEFSLSVTPDVLWPANHKMVEIVPTFTVSDNCDEWPEVTLVNITMDDDEAKGNGHRTDDIEVGPNGIRLRAERSGTGNGRVYTITYRAVDDCNNVSIDSATVTVPHDRRKY